MTESEFGAPRGWPAGGGELGGGGRRGPGAPLPGGSWRRPRRKGVGEAGGNRPVKGGETAHFCRRARRARARGANCDSNPLPRGAAEPRARSRRALPLALAALGNLEPNRCPLRPGLAHTGRGPRVGVGGWFSRQQSGKAAGETGRRRGGGNRGRAAGEQRKEEEAAAAAARRGGGEGRAGRGGPGAPRREGPREAGAGAGGVGGGEGWGRERK